MPKRVVGNFRVVAYPGQFGGHRDRLFADFDKAYGAGNWAIAWRMPSGAIWDFDKIFWEVYVAGYRDYFQRYPDEAEYLKANFSYAYDLTEISEEQAYSPDALVGVAGLPNQFHHVALNQAIGRGNWRGSRPVSVRGPGTLGEHWHPGHIRARHDQIAPRSWSSSELLPKEGVWWEPWSIEAVYQSSKILCVRRQNDSERLLQ